MMDIRIATQADAELVIWAGKQLIDSTGWCKSIGIEDDVQSTLPDYRKYLAAGIFVAVIAEDDGKPVGVILAGIAPWIWGNRAEISCDEVFWWVHDEYRKTGLGITLLDELEKEAKARGATISNVSIMEILGKTEAYSRVLARKGYVLFDHKFTKSLKGGRPA